VSGKVSIRLIGLVTVALGVAAGVAYATIPDSANVYHACMLRNVGTIRLIDPSLPASSLLGRCTSLEREISWNELGATGAAGPPGPTGPSGPQGPSGLSDAYSTFTTGDVPVTDGGPGGTGFTTVATLTIPNPGSYVISATVNMGDSAPDPGAAPTHTYTCQLVAGTDTTTAFPIVTYNQPGNVSLQDAVTFTAPGTAIVRCIGVIAFAFNTRITAIAVDNLTNTAS
jgi:hypothetical protein